MYTLNSFLLLAGIGAIILLWFESLRVREQLTRMCRELCEKSDLQFLDQTVALASIGIARSRRKRWQLRRVYQFEVSGNGADRHIGYITLIGKHIEAVQIDNPEGMTTIYPALPGQLH
jgi:hypothetical protein